MKTGLKEDRDGAQAFDPQSLDAASSGQLQGVQAEGTLAQKRPVSRISARLKIIYLVAVSVLVLSVGHVYLTLSLLLLQSLIWLGTGVRREDLKVFKNGFGFALALIFFDSFFSTPRDVVLLSIADFPIGVSSAGFFASLHAVARFFTVLMTSMVVRRNMGPEEFVVGLEGLKVSKNFAQVLDGILSSLEGRGGQKGSGRGQGRGQGGGKNRESKDNIGGYSVRGILKGDFHFFVEMIQTRLSEAKSKMADQDWAVISAVAMLMVSLRLVRVFPGLPFAPGHKNILIVPLFILVAALSKKRFSATYVGLLSGTINFLFGYGKYGALGVLQFAVPGLVVDLMIGLTRISQSIFIFALIGFCTGLARVSVEFLIAIVFGLPDAFFAFLTPLVLSQCGFAALSAPLSKFLFRHFRNAESLERKVGYDVTGNR